MQTINEFLKENDISIEDGVEIQLDVAIIKDLIFEYAKKVREEQIKNCAVGAAHYTAITVRSVPERLDEDYKNHLNVCRVPINIR